MENSKTCFEAAPRAKRISRDLLELHARSRGRVGAASASEHQGYWTPPVRAPWVLDALSGVLLRANAGLCRITPFCRARPC